MSTLRIKRQQREAINLMVPTLLIPHSPRVFHNGWQVMNSDQWNLLLANSSYTIWDQDPGNSWTMRQINSHTWTGTWLKIQNNLSRWRHHEEHLKEHALPTVRHSPIRARSFFIRQPFLYNFPPAEAQFIPTRGWKVGLETCKANGRVQWKGI